MATQYEHSAELFDDNIVTMATLGEPCFLWGQFLGQFGIHATLPFSLPVVLLCGPSPPLLGTQLSSHRPFCKHTHTSGRQVVGELTASCSYPRCPVRAVPWPSGGGRTQLRNQQFTECLMLHQHVLLPLAYFAMIALEFQLDTTCVGATTAVAQPSSTIGTSVMVAGTVYSWPRARGGGGSRVETAERPTSRALAASCAASVPSGTHGGLPRS